MNAPRYGLPALVLAAATAAQSPEFDVTYLGYDTNRYPNGLSSWAARSADFDGDGLPDLAVSSWYASPELSIVLNDGSGGFLPPQEYPLALGALDLEAGDFDNDGDVDVAVCETGQFWDGQTFALWINDGSGGMAFAGRFACGQGPTGMTAADFDGDGWLDVAVAHDRYLASASTIAVVLNDRTGGFREPSILVASSATYGIDSGDLDGDGRPDLAVAHEASKITVLRNTGSGFGPPTVHPALSSAVPQEPVVEIADADGDGDLDVLFSHTTLGGGITAMGQAALYRNDGSGNLAPAVGIPLVFGRGATGLAVADVTGDGVPDLVAALLADLWALVPGDGSGGFLPARSWAAGQDSSSVLTPDVDGDGDIDVVAIGRVSLEACVFENPGDGSFPRASTVDLVNPSLVPVSFSNLGASDLDRDGDLDFVVSYSANFVGRTGTSVRLNRGDGTFGAPIDLPTPFSTEILIADVDGDGVDDLVSSGATPFPGRATADVRLGRGNGTFGTRWTGPQYSGEGALAVADVDGDGRTDLLVAAAFRVLAARNTGSGFAAPLQHALSSGVSAIAAGDFDGDGDADIATNSAVQGYLEISLSRGNGTFDPPFLAQTGRGVQSVVAADVDEDGALDLVAGYALDGQGVSIARGRGDGSFLRPINLHGSYGSGLADNVTVADVDRDGDLDVLAANPGSNDVSLWRSRGDGTYERQIRLGVGYGSPLQRQGASDVVWGEFTGDGIHDLAVLCDPNGHTVVSYYPGVAIVAGTLRSWTELGGSIRGTAGVPLLAGTGPLTGGTAVEIALRRARPNAAAVHVLGATRIDRPLFGGTLVPAPALALPFTTTAEGGHLLTATWPGNLAPGSTLYVQSWIADPAAARGFAASPALRARQP